MKLKLKLSEGSKKVDLNCSGKQREMDKRAYSTDRQRSKIYCEITVQINWKTAGKICG